MTQPKRALITGITGQDGSYLAEFLLEKGFLDFIVHRHELKDKTAQLIRMLTNKNGPVE